MKVATVFLTTLLLLPSLAPCAVVGFSGYQYVSYEGIPFAGGSNIFRSPFVRERHKMSEFYLEDFEDHLLNTPYITSLTGFPEPYGRVSSRRLWELGLGDIVHSVDGDDGVYDGHGILGDSWFADVALDFSRNAEGRLPNYVGLVITSGYYLPFGDDLPVYRAFGPDGEFLLDLSINVQTFQSDFMNGSDTAGDTFVGLYASQGISRVVSLQTLARQIDHVQYGWERIPEPGAAALAVSALSLAAQRRSRSRRSRKDEGATD